VEKIQQAQQKHPEMQQRQFDLELAEEKKLQQERTRQLHESEQARIRREEERRQRRRDDDRKEHRDPETSSVTGEEDAPMQGGRIDVKV
jgi:hypothetical protein